MESDVNDYITCVVMLDLLYGTHLTNPIRVGEKDTVQKACEIIINGRSY